MRCRHEYGAKKCHVYDSVGMGFGHCDYVPQSVCPSYEEEPTEIDKFGAMWFSVNLKAVELSKRAGYFRVTFADADCANTAIKVVGTDEYKRINGTTVDFLIEDVEMEYISEYEEWVETKKKKHE